MIEDSSEGFQTGLLPEHDADHLCAAQQAYTPSIRTRPRKLACAITSRAANTLWAIWGHTALIGSRVTGRLRASRPYRASPSISCLTSRFETGPGGRRHSGEVIVAGKDSFEITESRLDEQFQVSFILLSDRQGARAPRTRALTVVRTSGEIMTQ
jgi:hypothetical protein